MFVELATAEELSEVSTKLVADWSTALIDKLAF
jgi:hypothetical protein